MAKTVKNPRIAGIIDHLDGKFSVVYKSDKYPTRDVSPSEAIAICRKVGIPVFSAIPRNCYRREGCYASNKPV